VFQIVKDPVNLVELAFGINVLYAELIAVRFADRTSLVSPTVPDMGVEIVNVVALFLPYPQDFVDSRFECGATKCDYRKFFRQIVAVDYAKLFYRMCGRAVEPVRTYGQVFVAYAVVENVSASVDENLVCYAHLCG